MEKDNQEVVYSETITITRSAIIDGLESKGYKASEENIKKVLKAGLPSQVMSSLENEIFNEMSFHIKNSVENGDIEELEEIE